MVQRVGFVALGAVLLWCSVWVLLSWVLSCGAVVGFVVLGIVMYHVAVLMFCCWVLSCVGVQLSCDVSYQH